VDVFINVFDVFFIVFKKIREMNHDDECEKNKAT